MFVGKWESSLNSVDGSKGIRLKEIDDQLSLVGCDIDGVHIAGSTQDHIQQIGLVLLLHHINNGWTAGCSTSVGCVTPCTEGLEQAFASLFLGFSVVGVLGVLGVPVSVPVSAVSCGGGSPVSLLFVSDLQAVIRQEAIKKGTHGVSIFTGECTPSCAQGTVNPMFRTVDFRVSVSACRTRWLDPGQVRPPPFQRPRRPQGFLNTAAASAAGHPLNLMCATRSASSEARNLHSAKPISMAQSRTALSGRMRVHSPHVQEPSMIWSKASARPTLPPTMVPK